MTLTNPQDLEMTYAVDRLSMRFEQASWKNQKDPLVHLCLRAPTAAEQELLHLICEQLTIPLDQLARFAGQSYEEMQKTMLRLEETGCIVAARVPSDEEPWFWVSERGAEAAALGLQSRIPGVTGFALRRAVNEVRLEYQRIAPEARWISTRLLEKGRRGRRATPTAVSGQNGESHAILVLPALRARPLLRAQIERYCAEYASLTYFCPPATLRSMERLRAESSPSNLYVRPVPNLVDGEAAAIACSSDSPPPTPCRRVRVAPPEPWALPILGILAQQSAVPVDQLARFVSRDVDEMNSPVQSLVQSGHVIAEPVFDDQPEWVRLSYGGSLHAEPRLPWIERLGLGRLGLLHAVNEVRLYVKRICPEALWQSRREIEAEERVRGHGSHPHAVVHVNGESHAIEVRAGNHQRSLLKKTAENRLERFDAVVFFGSVSNCRRLERLRDEHGWHDVGIVKLPFIPSQ